MFFVKFLKKKHKKNTTSVRIKTKNITEKLESIYKSPCHGNKSNPLDELIYIILSIQTTSPSYQRVYKKLKSHVGSWKNIQAIKLTTLKSIIKDAGLSNQKAPRIKQIINRLISDFGKPSLNDLKDFPDDEIEKYLMSLPGVGIKTAKCVMMYSFSREVLPVDTHIMRVSKRLGLVHQDTRYSKIHEQLENIVSPGNRYSFHVNVLAHGQTICSAKDPKCIECCIRRTCKYYRDMSKK